MPDWGSFPTPPISCPEPVEPARNTAVLEDLDCVSTLLEEALVQQLFSHSSREGTRATKRSVASVDLTVRTLDIAPQGMGHVIRPLAEVTARATLFENPAFAIAVGGGAGFVAGDLGDAVSPSDRLRLFGIVELRTDRISDALAPALANASLSFGIEYAPYLAVEGDDPDATRGTAELTLRSAWGLGPLHPVLSGWLSTPLSGGRTRGGLTGLLQYDWD